MYERTLNNKLREIVYSGFMPISRNSWFSVYRAQANLEELEKQCFLRQSGKTWKTQGVLGKYFKFSKILGNSAEIDFWINLLLFLATIFFEWCSSLFTLYTIVTDSYKFFYLYIQFIWKTGCCLKWPNRTVFFRWGNIFYFLILYYVRYLYFSFFLMLCERMAQLYVQIFYFCSY